MIQETVLIVPGLRDHVADHWQALLQARLPKSRCVPRLGKENLSLAAWVAALDDSVAACEEPPLIVAHSAGVIMLAHWAARYPRPVRGALLATPPDFTQPLPPGYPTRESLAANGWLPVPKAPFAFRTVLGASRDDPICSFEAANAMATSWGSRVLDLGRVGHLNPASGFGEWPDCAAYLAELAAWTAPAAAVI